MKARTMTGQEHDRGRTPGVVRRRFLAGVGASGLATAGAVFGFAQPASAEAFAGCCVLCCSPSHSVASCESGSHYVWTCSESAYLFCSCCEHGQPCNKCNSTNYSSYSCSYD
jgi:hypothetical protein